ncbi:pimeloyl-ACP methyl ester carboxylesterase [Halalkalibacter nanhaiisediminis]|uniref:Pimeloyl-ACP methyl ester carboxylesterase n=2 Tax=Halalkalibacter nanhaiisediminis TaxID=688079 RepID=A0A562QSK3_9BACI|nr:pimeloyl-ACP methyl ester carboxylesterase [Halalkalibacter nanhaiisediminis]
MPIVFCHPPVMGHLTFRFQRPLAKSYQLIFVDLLDSGRTTRVHPVSSVTDLMEMVHALVVDLKLGPVILCGYSNGGAIPQEFALQYPDQTAGVILIGGFPEVSTFLLKKEFELGIWAARKQLLNLFSLMLPAAHFNSHTCRRDMANFIKQADGPTLQRIYEAGMKYVSTDRLQHITAPLLLIYGARDLYMRSYLLPYCQKVKDIDIAFVSNVAHQVPTKRPDECNQIIDSWIKRKSLA